MGDIPVEVALHIQAEHSEGPLWDAATARLWWVDISGKRVHCFDPASHSVSAWSVGGQSGGVIISETGEPVVASPEGLAVLDQRTGQLDLRVPIEQDQPENRANDVKVDGRGRAWVGTMAFDKRPRSAALYWVDGAIVTCVVDGLTISNGPAFDESRGRMYLADTGICILDVFDLDPATSALTGRRRFLDFKEGTGLAGWPGCRRRRHAVGRAGACRSRPSLLHRRHPRRCGRATDIESHLGGRRWR